MAKKRRTSAQVKLAKAIKKRNYKKHAKALRASHLFSKEMFNAKDGGVDLRTDPDKWPPATKARITNYWRELAPRLSGGYVVKRYWRPERLERAAEAALQPRLLKGQKAVAFSVDRNQKLEVTFDRKDRITVKRDGIAEDKLWFDMDEMRKDAVAEVKRVLKTTKTQVFKMVTGENESKRGYTRSALISAVGRWVIKYAADDPANDVAKYDKWMFGLIEYPTLRVATQITKRAVKHEKEVDERKKVMLAERARDQRAMTAAEKKSVRATGRKGRVR